MTELVYLINSTNTNTNSYLLEQLDHNTTSITQIQNFRLLALRFLVNHCEVTYDNQITFMVLLCSAYISVGN